MLRDDNDGYGLISRLLHWLLALAIFGLFALGYWMVDLDYTSAYYNLAPSWHEAIGIGVFAAMVLRVVWRLANPKPSMAHLSRIEQISATAVHWAFYVLIFIILVSGYVISTADGRSIDLGFGFTVPSLFQMQGIESLSGRIHWMVSYAVMALVALHTIAALKHHFIDRDDTLKRMWRAGSKT